MTANSIRDAVLRALKEIQLLSGREWVPLTDTSRPISKLPGFDSPNGVEFTCLIEEYLNCEVPLDENLCVEDLDGGHRRARTVGQIVARLEELVTVKTLER
jgi:hypothetical protein